MRPACVPVAFIRLVLRPHCSIVGSGDVMFLVDVFMLRSIVVPVVSLILRSCHYQRVSVYLSLDLQVNFSNVHLRSAVEK